jgi:hypothetical protein
MLWCSDGSDPYLCSHSRVRGLLDSWPYFTVSDSKLPNLIGYFPVFILGWPSYTPGHWVPFSSSLTTRRDTVKVFDIEASRVRLPEKRVHWPFPNNGRLFWLHYSGLSAAMSQYVGWISTPWVYCFRRLCLLGYWDPLSYLLHYMQMYHIRCICSFCSSVLHHHAHKNTHTHTQFLHKLVKRWNGTILWTFLRVLSVLTYFSCFNCSKNRRINGRARQYINFFFFCSRYGMFYKLHIE